MAAQSIIPKSDLEVLNQEIDEEQGFYRIRARRRVHYLTIKSDTFDNDTMCQPQLLIPNLPDFPDDNWTRMAVQRQADGSLESIISWETLPAVTAIWHPKRVDVLTMKQVDEHKSNVHEVLFEGRPAISKIARFDWRIPDIENETRAYRILQSARESDGPWVAPAFLAHLTENGRVIGMLLEKLEGDFASISDLSACTDLVRKLHRIGIVHGDVNRYNFIMDRYNGVARVVDFEHSGPYEEAGALIELGLLESQLSEETGRGGPGIETEVETEAKYVLYEG